MFEIKINRDRKSSFIAQHYNFSTERDAPAENKYFEGVIKKEDFESITSTLNYIDFTNLNSQYSVMYTDAPSATLKITYDNGKVKHIEDYGKKGTYGLIALYEMFNNLRFNQDWKPTKEPEGIRINNF